VQYRYKHPDALKDPQKLSKMLRYMAYRDPTSPGGQLFTKDGLAGDLDRKALSAYVDRSLKDVRTDRGRTARAAYRFVLSPERADGLDLRELTRTAMAQLERDSGGRLPPWVAAIHRNTAHPHVHIVMAARREVGPGRFQGVVLSKPRLARMKQAIGLELVNQRGGRTFGREIKPLMTLSRERHAEPRPFKRADSFVRNRNAGHVSEPWLQRLGRVLRQLSLKDQIEMEREMRKRGQEREWER
jgi:type IV secretory pathway VirD2 relaxase